MKKMSGKISNLLFILALTWRVVASEITVNANAYDGLVVALRDDLDKSLCDEYVQGIKDTFTQASTLLHLATDGKLSYGKVTIVVPGTWNEPWTCTGVTADSNAPSYEQAHLRIGPRHPVFLNNPFTQQPRGCGHPGDFMYMSHQFVRDNETNTPRGSALVHEWAKYRWGVFEEYGLRGDPIFPSVVRHPINNTLTPNYCVDGDVEGNYFQCDDNSLSSDCYFTPDLTQETNVTSSLLATPFLESVVKFCDDTTHDPDVPTKHNLLCDKQSVWKVMSTHPDLKDATAGEAATPSFTVQYKPVITPVDNIVFLLDITAVMDDALGRWEILKESVQQFILYEVKSGTQVGIVTFANTEANIVASLTTLLDSDTSRRDLAAKVKGLMVDDAQTSKSITAAINKGKEALNGGGGRLVLITANLQQGDAEDLVTAADGSAVWPVLYPHNPDVSTDLFDQLVASVGTQVLLVENEVTSTSPPEQKIENNLELTRSILEATQDNSLTELASGTCPVGTQAPCDIILDIPNGDYESDFVIEVTHETRLTITITVVDQNGDTIPSINNDLTMSEIFKETGLLSGSYKVTVGSNFATNHIIGAALLGVKKPVVETYTVDVWASTELNNLQYSDNSAPVIFAKVKSGHDYVIKANVTAEVKSSDDTLLTSLILRDDGTGADVTGNDGVYSAYLTGLTAASDVTLVVTANGAAQLVSSLPVKTPPINPQDANHVCCGSSLTVIGVNIALPTTTTDPLPATVVGTVPPNLPPGRVKDLRVGEGESGVVLAFTATGADLDAGTVDKYEVTYTEYGTNNVQTAADNTTWQPGDQASTPLQAPECSKQYVVTIVAFDAEGSKGGSSNEVSWVDTCEPTEPPTVPPPPPNALSGGEIAGIVIGVILGLLLIAAIVYLVLNRNNKNDNWLWKIITCKCKKNEDNIYNPPAPRSRPASGSVIRNRAINSSTTPVTSLDDLYSKPIKRRTEDDDDGGFGEASKRKENNSGENISGEKMSMNDLGENASVASSFPPNHYNHNYNNSINEVGLPPLSGPPNYGPPRSNNQTPDPGYNYNQDGYNYNQNGYNQDGYNQNGYNQNGYNQDGYNQNGYSQNGHNQDNYNYNQDNYNYNQGGYTNKGYNQDTTRRNNTQV